MKELLIGVLGLTIIIAFVFCIQYWFIKSAVKVLLEPHFKNANVLKGETNE